MTPVAACRADVHALRQHPRRERESAARNAAAAFTERWRLSCRHAAKRLYLSSRTLASWRSKQRTGRLHAIARGRPVREPQPEERLAVEGVLAETGPRLGVPTLRKSCTSVPPCVLNHLLHLHRQEYRENHKTVTESLHWQRPGSVWAIDHSQPPKPIDGIYPQILAVRDLASGMQLAWSPVKAATTEETLRVLDRLVREHSPPLVLKNDNGSAFLSESFADWLGGFGIVPLRSPVRMPQFNGSCEAGIGAAKRRTEWVAARAGRFTDWTTDDLFSAQSMANHENYPRGFHHGTPADAFESRCRISLQERRIFGDAVIKCVHNSTEGNCPCEQKSADIRNIAIHRRAVRHVLVDLGYLVITRRTIPQPLPAKKCATIT